MRLRRNRIQNMTPAQRDAQRQRRIKQTWLEAVAWGLGEVMKTVNDTEDCDTMRELIETHMREAITEYERASKKRKPAKKKAAA
jgi:hypothetical protein